MLIGLAIFGKLTTVSDVLRDFQAQLAKICCCWSGDGRQSLLHWEGSCIPIYNALQRLAIPLKHLSATKSLGRSKLYGIFEDEEG